MTHLTLFGGAELEMPPEGQTVITVFGGTDLTCPTVAQSLVRLAVETPRTTPWSRREEAARRSSLLVTVFGGTSIRRPLLAREYLEAKDLLASSRVDPGDFQVLWLQHTARPVRETYRAVTLFGACELTLPGKQAEREALDGLRARGAITGREHAELLGLLSEERSVALGRLPGIAAGAREA